MVAGARDGITIVNGDKVGDPGDPGTNVVGCMVGLEGCEDGCLDGCLVGCLAGCEIGSLEGCLEGSEDGGDPGRNVGAVIGDAGDPEGEGELYPHSRLDPRCRFALSTLPINNNVRII